MIRALVCVIAAAALTACSSGGGCGPSSVGGRYDTIMADRSADASRYNQLGRQDRNNSRVADWVGICAALSADDTNAARAILAEDWPAEVVGAAHALARALVRERSGFDRCADASSTSELDYMDPIPNIAPQLTAMRNASRRARGNSCQIVAD